ncbi:MAG: cupredoxin family copper-binding protein [Patescibacteria group bacterium]|nr:cupredoxin family copper-binding protein [Patescibacteria group bacterium]
MNKTIIVIVILGIIAAAGGVYYFSFPKKNPASNSLSVPNNTSGQESVLTASTTPSTAQVVQVAIKNFAFEPAELQIGVGAEVKWTNQDPVNHTITGADFQSGQISNGQAYSHIFETAGSYDYHCSIHPSMQGRVIVIP